MEIYRNLLPLTEECMSKEKNSGPSADFFESPAKTGWLTKLGGTGLKANWRRRYVVLDHHYLFYYKTDKDRSPAGIICLPEYDIVAKADFKECKKQNSFVITASSNIVATTQSEQKRPYYMYTETEQECHEWIVAVEAEMTAMIDPDQKPYFSVSDTGLHTTVKNGFQDVIVGNFDDITRSEDGPKLEHVTANRPKKPHTRAPSRGAKDFVTFDEDDVSTFSFSPLSELEEPKKVEKRTAPKKPPHSIKPMKPPSDTFGPLPERPIITKPKPAVKPNFLKSSSLTETATSPVKSEIQSLPTVEKSATETETTEFTPKPTPRRKAPTIPETSRESKIIPPTPPTHPRSQTQAPPPSEPIQPPRPTEPTPDTSPARRHAPSIPQPPPEDLLPPSTIKHSISQLESPPHDNTTIRQSPSLPAVLLRGTPSPHDPIPERRSNTPSPTPDTIVSPLETASYVEPYFTKLSSRIGDVSDSESSDSENIYQVPGTDPIYDIPSGRPVLFQHQTETETETEIEPESNKIPLQKLHSVGHSVTPSPKPSTEGPNYTDLVTGYYCSFPSSNSPLAPPLPAHQRVTRNHIRSQSLPKEYHIPTDQNEQKRRSSSSSRPNSSLMEAESSERMLSQIRELEEQLFALTSSPRRQSLSPFVSQSNSVSQILLTDGQRLVDSLRSVVFEAITFHKQSSELLQSAKTEKRIAEKERRDAEKNSENLSNLIAKLQQST